MESNKRVLATFCMLLTFMLAHAEVTNKVGIIRCYKTEYSCCRIAHGALNENLKAKLYQENLAFLKGYGCPIIYYHDGIRPQLLFHLSYECVLAETPLIIKPSSRVHTWRLKSMPQKCSKVKVQHAAE